MPISSGNTSGPSSTSPSSTSHYSSSASTTTSTSGSPSAERNLKRKLENDGIIDQMLEAEACTEAKNQLIHNGRFPQEGEPKKHEGETEVMNETFSRCLGVVKRFCNDREPDTSTSRHHVQPLEDGEIDVSVDSATMVTREENEGSQIVQSNKRNEVDVPHLSHLSHLSHWCNVCAVWLPEDTAKVRKMHNKGKRHQAALQQIRTHEQERSEDLSKNILLKISNDGKTSCCASGSNIMARLGDKRSVVLVSKDSRRNVVARLGQKTSGLTPQRKVEFLEDRQERLEDDLSEQLSHALDVDGGVDLRGKLKDRRPRCYHDYDKVETNERIVLERKVEDYGQELEEISTKIQRARYRKMNKNMKKDELITTSNERIVTFGMKMGSEHADTCKNETKITPDVQGGRGRRKIAWP